MSVHLDLSGIESAAIELDTALEALCYFAESMNEGDRQMIVYFMINHFGGIRDKLRRELNKAFEAEPLKVVNAGKTT